MQVTIATIPADQEESWRLFWDWKFFLVDGVLKNFVGGEDDEYEEGFVAGIKAAVPNADVQYVRIDKFDVESCMQSGDEQLAHKLIAVELERLIPVGEVVER